MAHRAIMEGHTIQWGPIVVQELCGMAQGRFCYEGCDEVLSDRRFCSLGTVPCQPRGQNADHFGGQRQQGHLCRCIEEGRMMFLFFIYPARGDLQVWDEAGLQLMGMTTSAFLDSTHSCGLLEVISDWITQRMWLQTMEQPANLGRRWLLAAQQPQTQFEPVSTALPCLLRERRRGKMSLSMPWRPKYKVWMFAGLAR